MIQSIERPDSTSIREHQKVNGRCKHAHDVKARENDMDWRPCHATTMIRRLFGDKLLQFSHFDFSISAHNSESFA